MKIYYKCFKRTIVSQILIKLGAGLFALEDMSPNEMKNEYTDELTQKDEFKRRSIINVVFAKGIMDLN